MNTFTAARQNEVSRRAIIFDGEGLDHWQDAINAWLASIEWRRSKTDSEINCELVGTRGFEPPTPCTPCKCATRLRHVPTGVNSKEFKKRVRMICEEPAEGYLRQAEQARRAR